MSKPQTILITGSKGVLGRRIIEYIKINHQDILLIESPVDLTVRNDVMRFIDSLPKIDIIFHLAAMVPVQEVNKNPTQAFSVNVGGTLNLLHGLQSRSSKVIFASSSHVYRESKIALREDDHLEPTSLYGKTKLIAENLISAMSDSSNWNYIIARIFSMHDANQKGSYLRTNLETRFLKEDLSKPFHLQGGRSTRDFLSAEKVAELLVKLAWSNTEGIVNVASGVPKTIASFAQSIAPRKLDIVSTGKSNSLFADIAKLNQVLGIS